MYNLNSLSYVCSNKKRLREEDCLPSFNELTEEMEKNRLPPFNELIKGMENICLATPAKRFKTRVQVERIHIWPVNQLFLVGMQFMLTNRWREAEEKFQKILKIEPQHVCSLCMLGKIFMQTNRWTEAEKKFQEALKADPKHMYALCELMMVYKVTNRCEKAEETFQEALKIDPQHELLLTLKRIIGI